MCLEFSTDNSVFGLAEKVEYLASYPDWNHQTLEDSLKHALLTKSDDWSYEHEYRIIGLGEDTNEPYLDLPSGALQAVIVGCEADYARIYKLVEKLTPDLKVKRAIRAPNQYKLKIVEDPELR